MMVLIGQKVGGFGVYRGDMDIYEPSASPKDMQLVSLDN